MTATSRSPRPAGRGGSGGSRTGSKPGTRTKASGSRAPKKGSGRGSTSRKAPTRKPGASGRSSTAKGRPADDTTLVKVAKATSRATEGHRADLAGLALLLLALLSAFGIYGDGLGGPFGRAAARGFGLLVGSARILVPPALALAGALLIRGRTAPLPEPDPETGEIPHEAHGPARRALGGILVAVAALGLLHLAQGSPSLDAPGDELIGAAGFLGAAIGEPLAAVVATGGAIAVLLLVLIAGLVLIADLTLQQASQKVARATVAVVGPVWRASKAAFGSLFHLEREKDEGTDGEVPLGGVVDITDGAQAGAAIYDFEAEAEPPAPPPPPRRRKKAAPEPVEEPEQLEIDLGPGAAPSAWKLPPAKLLTRVGAQAVDRKAVEDVGRHLEHALAEHNVETRLSGMTVGPTVTRYELELGPGVKVARVTSLHRDIAYAMATPDVRILAPIPGKQAIGVEIPNASKQLVTVGDILASPEARAARHPLEVAVGRDIDGQAVMAPLASMPHVLIAGATGAGKSSCINSLLTSVLMRATPDQVRMILVDPKQVEMGQYNRLPHLLTEVVTDPKKAANALAWAVREMERRYDLLANVGFRDITGYNAAHDKGLLQPDRPTTPSCPASRSSSWSWTSWPT